MGLSRTAFVTGLLVFSTIVVNTVTIVAKVIGAFTVLTMKIVREGLVVVVQDQMILVPA